MRRRSMAARDLSDDTSNGSSVGSSRGLVVDGDVLFEKMCMKSSLTEPADGDQSLTSKSIACSSSEPTGVRLGGARARFACEASPSATCASARQRFPGPAAKNACGIARAFAGAISSSICGVEDGEASSEKRLTPTRRCAGFMRPDIQRAAPSLAAGGADWPWQGADKWPADEEDQTGA